MKLETFINKLLDNGVEYWKVFDLIAEAAARTKEAMLPSIEDGDIALTTAIYKGLQVTFDSYMDMEV